MNDDLLNGISSNLGFNGKPVRIEVLGYMDRIHIPDHYLMGPPSLLTGEMSRKACSLIAAMAEALERTSKVAMCVFYKKSGKPGHFGALFPLREPKFPSTIHLIFMALPYSGDVQDLNKDIFPLEGFMADVQPDEADVVDSLIDSLQLPEDVLAPGTVPNPYSRSWYQTLMQRAIDPESEPVLWRPNQDTDVMATPPAVLMRATGALDRFRECFPTKDMQKLAADEKAKNQKVKGKRQVLNFEDYR